MPPHTYVPPFPVASCAGNDASPPMASIKKFEWLPVEWALHARVWVNPTLAVELCYSESSASAYLLPSPSSVASCAGNDASPPLTPIKKFEWLPVEWAWNAWAEQTGMPGEAGGAADIATGKRAAGGAAWRRALAPAFTVNYVYNYIHICIYINAYTFMYLYSYAFIYMCLSVCICIYICKHKNIHIYTYIHTCIYVYIYIYIYRVNPRLECPARLAAPQTLQMESAPRGGGAWRRALAPAFTVS